MIKINENYLKLKAGYLFPEIARRCVAFQQANPDARIIRLGIGDVTLPLPGAVRPRSTSPGYRLKIPSWPQRDTWFSAGGRFPRRISARARTESPLTLTGIPKESKSQVASAANAISAGATAIRLAQLVRPALPIGE